MVFEMSESRLTIFWRWAGDYLKGNGEAAGLELIVCIIIFSFNQSGLSFPNTGGVTVFSDTLPASLHRREPLGEKARRDIQLLSGIISCHRYICNPITLQFLKLNKPCVKIYIGILLGEIGPREVISKLMRR